MDEADYLKACTESTAGMTPEELAEFWRLECLAYRRDANVTLKWTMLHEQLTTPLRDLLAGMAMQSIVRCRWDDPDGFGSEEVAEVAYDVADAMLAERACD
jgi:hypothetical protein